MRLHPRSSEMINFVYLSRHIAPSCRTYQLSNSPLIDQWAIINLLPREENTGLPVAETKADCAYGEGRTRQSFVEEGRTIHAKVLNSFSPKGLLPKSAFTIDLDAGSFATYLWASVGLFVRFWVQLACRSAISGLIPTKPP